MFHVGLDIPYRRIAARADRFFELGRRRASGT